MEAKSNSDGGISQLSQLSNRLASLHRTSSADANKTDSIFQFRDLSQGRASSLVNDAAFKSVACWLVDVSGDGNGNFLSCEKSKSSALEQSSAETLYHVFSASYQFLETLRGLQDRTFGRAHGGISRDAWTDTSSSSGSTHDTLNPHSSIVEHHLVMARHTLLLEIYIKLFTSLQCEVDRHYSRAGHGMVGQHGTADMASLADIRLVSVVQLSTYILDRQSQAVSYFLASEIPPAQPMQLEASSFTRHATDIQGAQIGAEPEVQSRLRRLRESLRI